MPEGLPCDLCGRPLWGRPLEHLEKDQAHHDAEVKRAAHDQFIRAMTAVTDAERAARDARRAVFVAREKLFLAREGLRVRVSFDLKRESEAYGSAAAKVHSGLRSLGLTVSEEMARRITFRAINTYKRVRDGAEHPVPGAGEEIRRRWQHIGAASPRNE